jgi:ArsR family transcriptional regulator
MFNYSQSTISQHVKILKESGLPITENKEKFVYYYLNKEFLHRFGAFFAL